MQTCDAGPNQAFLGKCWNKTETIRTTSTCGFHSPQRSVAHLCFTNLINPLQQRWHVKKWCVATWGRCLHIEMISDKYNLSCFAAWIVLRPEELKSTLGAWILISLTLFIYGVGNSCDSSVACSPRQHGCNNVVIPVLCRYEKVGVRHWFAWGHKLPACEWLCYEVGTAQIRVWDKQKYHREVTIFLTGGRKTRAKKDLAAMASNGWGLSNLDSQCQHQMLYINGLFCSVCLKIAPSWSVNLMSCKHHQNAGFLGQQALNIPLHPQTHIKLQNDLAMKPVFWSWSQTFSSRLLGSPAWAV